MKSYQHCEFRHEREAFAELERKLPTELDGIELYPSVYLSDASRNLYHECDLLVLAQSFAAVVELKHWKGEIEVSDNVWKRGGVNVRDPHEVNLPKAKVFKSLLEKTLPAAKIPFVQSITVLTHEGAAVSGADSAFDIAGSLDSKNGRVGDHLTFDGMSELAHYLKERVKRDIKAGRNQLRPQDFRRLVATLDQSFDEGPRREDFTDQISGFKIREEIENTSRYVSYLAEANPSNNESLYRLRVFGPASSDPALRAQQFRSLDILEDLPFHENIRPVRAHPNERNLVVEVCRWSGSQTLDQVLQAGNKLSSRFAARIVRDISRALDHIHNSDAGLIHRNITPRSIIVGRDDHIELTDFDLTFDPQSDFTVMAEDLTQKGKEYSAPETLAGKPDYKSDIYSLGKLFHELLSRRMDDIPEDDELVTLAEEMTSSTILDRPTAKNVIERISRIFDDSERASATQAQLAPSETISRDPQVGDTHDTWTLVEELGAGGTSKVFHGESHGDSATLKIFHPETQRDSCLAERDFLRRANSPFVAGFRGFTQWANSRWCIIQEFINGKSLRSLIDEGSKPDPELFKNISEQILTALNDIHSPSGLYESGDVEPTIHNDVTPGNIILNPMRKLAKLVDFGMASQEGLTVIGGTPGYVAQDLITKEGYVATPSGDLFSLGITLVEWATGIRPTDPTTIPPLFADELSDEIRGPLTQVLTRAISNGSDRYASAEEMLEGFKNAFWGEGLTDSGSNDEKGYKDRDPESPITPQGLGKGENSTSTLNSESEAFVEYLNTIHNVSADNRHALAEAQATSPFFSDLHVEMKLTESILEILSSGEESVIMLTGHAGDGKSTVAVEIMKRARGLALDMPLPHAPKEEEVVELGGQSLAIVKDMSELPATDRLQKLTEAMEDQGSALIVSNTGPLLGTFREYFGQSNSEKRGIEQDVLARLNEPLVGERLGDRNCFEINSRKKVYIANLSMLGNIDVAVKLLEKLTFHPAWDSCETCEAKEICPIKLNVDLLRSKPKLVQRRVGFVYDRLTAYGRRMTIRQIAAHLSFSLTSGRSCKEICEDNIKSSNSPVFSETFFGHAGVLTPKASNALFCLKQMADLHFGASSSPEFDQITQEDRVGDVVDLPSPTEPYVMNWKGEAQKVLGGESRRRLRRLVFIFGVFQPENRYLEAPFINEFLKSPMLQTLDSWIEHGNVGAGLEKQKFIRKTVGVLMEEFTGCIVPEKGSDKLFITLRRPDEKMFQSVQVVLKVLLVDEFDVVFSESLKLPVLEHERSGARLVLTLPLLDFIDGRSRGELTSSLDAIHRASLEQFRGELLGDTQLDSDVVTLLEVDAQGDIATHKFSPADNGNKLVYQ